MNNKPYCSCFENLLVGVYLTSQNGSYGDLWSEMENTIELIDARIDALTNA